MKKFISLLTLFWVAIAVVSAQNITRLEYSIDGFVAEGNGTSLAVPGNSNELNTTFDIDISSLEPGIHTVHFRAMNENGVWSFAAERSFYIPEAPIVDGIVAMEYSIDGFVKEGEGKNLPLARGTSQVDSLLEIDISGLEAGIHNIYFRSKNKLGIWSLPVIKSFVVVKPDTTKVEKIMYRFYNENYQGGWMSAMVDPARKNVDSVFLVSAAGLDMNQNYTIEFYAKNNRNVRGYSVFLNNVDLIVNHAPDASKDTLEVAVKENQVMTIGMDSLFSDMDLILGDSLWFSVEDDGSSGVSGFAAWLGDGTLSFSPHSGDAGVYSFWITTTDLAGATDSIQVVLTVNSITGIESARSDEAFSIFPNPANDYLMVAHRGSVQEYSLRVFSVDGQLLVDRKPAEKLYRLSLQGFSKGIYVIVLNDRSMERREKFVKQ